MLGLVLRTLRFRKAGFVALFLALFLGAAIVMACGGLMETGIRNNVPPQRLGAAAVVVTGDRSAVLPGSDKEDPDTLILPEEVPLDAELVGRIRRIPGVADAVGDVSIPATLLRNGAPVELDAESQGHGWASAALGPYRLTSGAPPAGDGELVVDAALADAAGVTVGDQVDVVARGTTSSYLVVGTAEPPDGDSTASPALFFSPGDVQRLVPDPDVVDNIGVLLAKDADAHRVRDRVDAVVSDDGAVALTADDRGRAEDEKAWSSGETLVALAGVFGGMATTVAVLVVATTQGLSVQQRERELALLRALGTTPGQLRRMILGETLVVSLVATAFAIVPGVALGRLLVDQLAAHDVVPEALRFSHGRIPTAAGIGIALLTASGAGLIASRRATRTRPTEALLEATLQRRWLSWWRVVFALIFLGGGMALALVTLLVITGPTAAATAGPTVIVWAIGFALLAPGITRAAIAVLGPPVRAMSGQSGSLAVLNARASSVRMAGAVTPVMFATGIAVGELFLLTTLVDSAQEGYTKNLAADVVLISSTGGFAPDVVDRVRGAPGVADASELVTSIGIIESPVKGGFRYDGWPLQGVDADAAAQTLPVSVTAGSLDDLRGETVALSTHRAAKLRRGIGDEITVRLGDGTRTDLRVVALFAADRRFETLVLSAELLAAHTTDGLPHQILVQAAGGTDSDQLVDELTTLVADQPGVRVADRGAMTAAYAQDLQTQTWVNFLLVGMIVAYTSISLVNSLVTTTSERRREFGLQRLVGFTPAQVMRMMGLEAALVAVIGIVLGTALSTTTLIPFSVAVSGSARPSGPVWLYLAVAGSAAALVLVATLVPTWLSLRSRPVVAASANAP